MKNNARRLEIGDKIRQMGQALVTEGTGDKNYTVAQTGTIMLLLSKLIDRDEDMFIFSEFCAMFTARMILSEGDEIEKYSKETLAKIFTKNKNQSISPKEDKPKKRLGGRKSKDSGDSETK